jgi:ectoine hydroxylase-related dioxygenase (phytanoyl-CoA dioxygenase family)
MIPERDVVFYREHGYVVVPDLLDGETLSAARQVIAELIEGARGVAIHTDIYDLEPTHRPDAPRVRRIKTPHLHHEVFRRIMHTPGMVEVLKQLLGPSGVRLHGSKLNMKAPQYGSPVEWHQDWAFYPHTNDDVLAVGVMLDDCALENGPLMVVPGSHKGPVHDHHCDGYFCGAIDPACDIDYAKAVPLVGRAGSMSFHHVRLVHGSAQNVSDKPRQLLLYEFTAADAFPLVKPVTDLAAFDANLIAGGSVITPRLADVPVRMPLPPAPHQGSIYENQTSMRSRYFAITGEARQSAMAS